MKFVGGYYDDRIFRGEKFEGSTLYSKDVDVYNLDGVLKLPFVENVHEFYTDIKKEKDREWDSLDDKEKAKWILRYIDGDDIAGLDYVEDDLKAEEYKKEILKEIIEKEKHSIYVGVEQDKNGNYRKVYEYKE